MEVLGRLKLDGYQQVWIDLRRAALDHREDSDRDLVLYVHSLTYEQLGELLDHTSPTCLTTLLAMVTEERRRRRRCPVLAAF